MRGHLHQPAASAWCACTGSLNQGGCDPMRSGFAVRATLAKAKPELPHAPFLGHLSSLWWLVSDLRGLEHCLTESGSRWLPTESDEPGSVGNHLTIKIGFKHLEPWKRAEAIRRFGYSSFLQPLRAYRPVGQCARSFKGGVSMSTPLQFNMYQVLLELQVPAEKAHALSEAYNREKEQVRKEVQEMVEKQLKTYVTQADADKAEGRVEKAVLELRGDVLKSINDLQRWIITAFLGVSGLTIVLVTAVLKLL